LAPKDARFSATNCLMPL